MDDSEIPAGRSEPDGGYKVGRGKPPLHTRFQKGNTRGRGRPPGSPNAKTAFFSAFNAKRKLKVDGREVKRTYAETAMMQLANKAAGGDLKAIATYLAHALKWETDDPVADIPRHVQERNLSVIDNLLSLKRLAETGLDKERGNDDRE